MKINGNDIRLKKLYETRDGKEAIITSFNSTNSYYKFTGLVDRELIHWFENGNILPSKNPHNFDIINLDKYNEPETKP